MQDGARATIVHIVPYAELDGSFGGPLSVAAGQVHELRSRGEDVVLVAGGKRTHTVSILDVPSVVLRSFFLRKFRFASLISPQLILWLLKNKRDISLAHVHCGRDLFSLVALSALAALKIPYVVQTHGMVAIDDRLIVRAIDKMLVVRLLRRARSHFVLTDKEISDLTTILGASSLLVRLPNGVASLPQIDASPSDAEEILFLARLHPRKRPDLFVAVAVSLHHKYPGLQWTLVGPDGGSAGSVLKMIEENCAHSYVRWEGPVLYGDVPRRMRNALVYVLPSENEPFPMSLLEALSLGVPSICTDTCGIASSLQDAGAVVVVPATIDALGESVDRLVGDAQLRELLSANARKVVREEFSVESVADQLSLHYW